MSSTGVSADVPKGSGIFDFMGKLDPTIHHSAIATLIDEFYQYMKSTVDDNNKTIVKFETKKPIKKLIKLNFLFEYQVFYYSWNSKPQESRNYYG